LLQRFLISVYALFVPPRRLLSAPPLTVASQYFNMTSNSQATAFQLHFFALLH
jgi:hypothetical protein